MLKSALRGPEANWHKEEVFPRVLEHSKTIGAKYFFKIKADKEISNFKAFLTSRAPNKIV